MSYCKNCGKEIDDDSKFCPSCGNPISRSPISDSPISASSVKDEPRPVRSYASKPEKKGGFLSVLLFILSIVVYFIMPGIIPLAIAAIVFILAIVSLSKRLALKGFTIIALIISICFLILNLITPYYYSRYYSYSCYGCSNAILTRIEKSILGKNKDTEIKGGIVESETTNKEETTSTAENATEPETTTIIETTTATETQANGVDPDLKATLDSYEAFIDEYVEFMNNYSADSSNSLTMLLEYTEMLSKYNEFAEKISNYNSAEMSDADAQYYFEVTSRCSLKLLEVAGSY